VDVTPNVCACCLHLYMGLWYNAAIAFLSQCDSAINTELRPYRLEGNRVPELKNKNQNPETLQWLISTDERVI